MKDEFRNKIVSICRETAKSLDMVRRGSRWLCEVTEANISREGVKRYDFYILDKNSGQEYEGQARVENEENAEWDVQKIE